MSRTTQQWLGGLAVAGFLLGMSLSVAQGDATCPSNAWWATATVSKVVSCLNESLNFNGSHNCMCPMTNVTYSWSPSGYTTESFTKSYTNAGEKSETLTVSIGQYNSSYTVNFTVVDVTGTGGSASFTNDGVATATPVPDATVSWEKISETSDDKKIPIDITDYPAGNTYVVKLKQGSGSGQIVVRAKHPLLDTCYVDLTIAIQGCEGAGQAGEDGDETDPYSWIALGRTKNGVLSGRLRIAVEEMIPALATPAGLSLAEFGGVDDVVRTPLNGTNLLRQVLARECLADIVVSNDFKYGVRLFRRAEVAAQDSNGLYLVADSAEPFVSFIFENPAASTNDVHVWRKTKIVQGLATVTEWEYALEGGLPQWTLRQGNGLRAETLSTVTNATGKIVTRQIKDAAQQVVSKQRETYQLFDWGLELVSWVTDPDGAALTTTKSYYDDANPGQYGKLRQVVNADGSWKRLDYDSDGRKTEVVSSWLDAGTNAAADQARALYYSYEPVYLYYLTTNLVVTNGVTNAVVVTNMTDSGVVNSALPRTTTEKILDQVVSKTYNAYYELADGERVEIEEQCVDPAAGYGAASNLRTVRVFHPFGQDAESGRIKEITLPDGRHEDYTYETGAWNLDPQPGQSVFTPGPGDYLRTTVTRGTTAHPDGLANKTTAEEIIQDKLGHEVMRETYVYTGSDYARVDWTVYARDYFGRVTVAYRANGSQSESTTIWGCCGKESEKDENGVEYAYSYDALKRLTQKIKVGTAAGEYPAQADQFSAYTYDAEGRVLSETVIAASLSQGRTNQYDLAGRLTNATDFAGLVSRITYSQDSRTTTETLPGGYTRITEKYPDGNVKSITGTVQISQYHEYGVNADGTKWNKIYSAADNSPVWVKTTTDLLDRPTKVEKPGYSTTETTERFYNNKGQLLKASTTGKPDTLYAYDEMGNQTRSGLDLNGDGTLDLAGLDRIADSEISYVQINNDWWKETVSRIYATDNNSTPLTNSVTRQRLTGFPVAGGGDPGSIAETITIDAYGNQTILQTTVDRSNKKVKQTTDVPDSSSNVVTVAVNGLMQSQTSKSGITTLYSYNSLSRRTAVTDARTGSSATHYDSHGWVDYVEDAAGHRTTFTFDPATGHRLSESRTVNGEPLTTYFAYTSYGKEEKIWGSASYPVLYEYDSYGRKTKQHTYRDGSGWSGPAWPASPGTADTTEWIYHEASGLLTAKTDATGKSVSDTYTAGGKFATRTWSRTNGTNSLMPLPGLE